MHSIGDDPARWERLLRTSDGGPDTGLDQEAFVSLYGPLSRNGARSFVVGQLGQSLDGRIATPTGHSHYVNGREALVHLHRLRALADAVVVGVGTVLADDPRLTVRHVTGPSPARIVIDPRGRTPAGAAVFADNGPRRLVLRDAAERGGSRRDGVEEIRLPTRASRFCPRAIVAVLAEHGFRRLLIEGGGNTVSAFLEAGALSRLHVCVAPLLIGSGPVGLSLPPIQRMDEACRPDVRVYGLGTDVLFDCAFGRE